MHVRGLTTRDKNLVQLKKTGTIWWRATIIPVLGAFLWFGSGALSSAKTGDEIVSNEIRAHSFIVVDDAGKEHAKFGMMDGGQAGMTVWNRKKSAAVSVSIDRLGMPRIAFENSKAEALLDFGILDDQYPAFVMHDANGRRRLGIMVTEGGAVAIGLYDTKKRNRCAVSLGRDGHPQVTVKDEKGKVRASLMLDDEGTCALVLFNRKEQERIVFQVDAQGQADAAVFGPDGKATWSAAQP